MAAVRSRRHHQCGFDLRAVEARGFEEGRRGECAALPTRLHASNLPDISLFTAEIDLREMSEILADERQHTVTRNIECADGQFQGHRRRWALRREAPEAIVEAVDAPHPQGRWVLPSCLDHGEADGR